VFQGGGIEAKRKKMFLLSELLDWHNFITIQSIISFVCCEGGGQRKDRQREEISIGTKR
jgi:hypothetical protein